MERSFEQIFRTTEQDGDKYLARLFGVLSEEIVRHWCRCPVALYANLGRLTLQLPGERRGHTLDFTLQRRATGETFAAELKCWPEFEGYRYLRLTSSEQLQRVRRYSGAAFEKLLKLAHEPESIPAHVGGRPVRVNGAILIWCAVDPDARDAVSAEYGFADVLSLETMLADLRAWAPSHWMNVVNRYRRWSNELFDYLV